MIFDKRTLFIMIVLLIIGIRIESTQSKFELPEPNFPERIVPSIKSEVFNYDIETYDLDSKTVEMNQYKNRVIVLNIFAVNNDASDTMLILWRAFYDKYKYSSNISILFMCYADANEISVVLGSLGIKYSVLTRKYKDETLEITDWPITFIIDRNGEVVFKQAGLLDWSKSKTERFIQTVIARGS